MLKKSFACLLCGMMLLTLLAACGGQAAPPASTAPPADAGSSAAPAESTAATDGGEDGFVRPDTLAKLQMVFYGEKSNGMRAFEEGALKQRLLDDLNVELTVTYVPWSEYGGGKIDMMLASGEDFATYTDVGYTGRCVSKQTIADLTEPASKYLDDLRAVVQEDAFDCYTFDGKLYSIPIGNKPNSGEGYCITVRQDLLEEVGMTEVTSVEQLEEFYDKVKAIYPETVGFCSPTNIAQILNCEISDGINIEFVDARVSEKAMIYTDASAADDVLYSWYESEEFKNCAEIARRWYEKGIIPQYALTNPSQLDTDWNAGKTLVKFGNPESSLGIDTQLQTAVPTARTQVYFLSYDQPKINTQLWSTAYIVSAAAKDVDRYVMLINYMQKNQENVDFLTYGVEGEDYTTEGDAVVRINTDTLFDGWMMDNINFMRFDSSIPQDRIDRYVSWDKDAIVGKSVGFMFDEEPVQIQKAQLDAIVEELGKPILWGFVSYEDNIDNLISRIKAAGFDEYMAEMQRQFTEFRASK